MIREIKVATAMSSLFVFFFALLSSLWVVLYRCWSVGWLRCPEMIQPDSGGKTVSPVAHPYQASVPLGCGYRAIQDFH